MVVYFAFPRALRFGGDTEHYGAVLILDIMLLSAVFLVLCVLAVSALRGLTPRIGDEL